MRKIFKTAFAAAALAATLGASAQAENTLGPLIAPENVFQTRLVEQAVIIDIRSKDEATSFIPGAISAPYGLWRGPQENPGQPKTAEELSALLSQLGLDTTSKVMIVNQGKNETDFGAAARVYWTLKSAGLEDLAIINGGMSAWEASSLRTVEAPATPEAKPVTITLKQDWTASREDVLAIVEEKKNVTLLDARPAAFYNGETQHDAAAKPGTLPHADIFTHSGWFSGGPAIVEQEVAKKLLAESGIKQDQPIVSFCNTGHWAATNWFALSELAGHENVKLYPESLVGWSNAGLPMDNTPGYLDNLMRSIKGLF